MHKSCNRNPRRKSKKASRKLRRSKPRRRSCKLKEDEFYSVQDNKVYTGQNICVKTLKNGSPVLYSKCPKHNNVKLYKFIKHSAEKRLTKKYGKCKR